MKKITLTVEVEVNDDYKYIAQDAGGQWYAYTDKPTLSFDFWNEKTGRLIKLSNSNIPNSNWKETLREI